MSKEMESTSSNRKKQSTSEPKAVTRCQTTLALLFLQAVAVLRPGDRLRAGRPEGMLTPALPIAIPAETKTILNSSNMAET